MGKGGEAMRKDLNLQVGSFGRHGREIGIEYHQSSRMFKAAYSFAWLSCMLIVGVSVVKKVKRAFNC